MDLFNTDFTRALQSLVTSHHGVYPRIPPRDIFFEDLVVRAFQNSGISNITLNTPGRSREDMIVAGVRLSIKTETGYSTDEKRITITKLSTTETNIWEPKLLVGRILEHLSHYEMMLMLRAIWQTPPIFHYQLLSIPIDLLMMIENAYLAQIGKREGRKSIGGDILSSSGEVLYHAHFDGADGKCQIRNLAVSSCNMLAEWDHYVPEVWHGNWPIHTSKTSEKRSKKRADGVHDEPPSSEDQQLGLF